MSGHGIRMLKYFHPITHKKNAPEDKEPPEGKELSNLSGPYLSKVMAHRHGDQFLAVQG